MSQEIKATVSLRIDQNISSTLDKSVQWDIATDGKKFSGEQTLSTSPANISIGNMTWSESIVIVLFNASTTTGENVILVRSAADQQTIPPRGSIIIYPNGDGTALQVKSATGTPRIDILAAKRA